MRSFAAMTPQRRTALISVLAACLLIALKLGTGLATHSLGLLSESVHSGTDLVAALLTFVALGVAVRPADPGHAYGHGKAEHLAALAEAAILVVASLWIGWRAILRLTDHAPGQVDPKWYALVIVGAVMVIDASRAFVSYRAGRRYRSPALQANALHFAGDFAGSTAVLLGLAAATAGYYWADSVAALFVAVLVLLAAGRLMRVNVDVLMDRVPSEAEAAAVAAIGAVDPPVELRRLRMRQAAGQQFADVVIGVPSGAAVGQGHAAADAVEEADAPRAARQRRGRPRRAARRRDGAPRAGACRRAAGPARARDPQPDDRARRAAARRSRSTSSSPASCRSRRRTRWRARSSGRSWSRSRRWSAVQTHLEPLKEAGEGRSADDAVADRAVVERIVREATGAEQRELRFLRTDDGLLAYLTIGLDPHASLADAHVRASEIEERIRRELPRSPT